MRGDLIAAAVGLSLASNAGAQHLIAHVGASYTRLSDHSRVSVAGARDVRAAISTRVSATPSFELGWFPTKHVGGNLGFGLPPTTTVVGRGDLASFNTLLRSKAGATTIAGAYRFQIGRAEPYIAIGAAYLHVFTTEGDSIREVKATSALGPLAQVGANIWVARWAGLFVDFKKSWFSTRLTGTEAGVPVQSSLSADPLCVSAGLALRF